MAAHRMLGSLPGSAEDAVHKIYYSSINKRINYCNNVVNYYSTLLELELIILVGVQIYRKNKKDSVYNYLLTLNMSNWNMRMWIERVKNVNFQNVWCEKVFSQNTRFFISITRILIRNTRQYVTMVLHEREQICRTFFISVLKSNRPKTSKVEQI